MSFVPTWTMETASNRGRKAGKENLLEACDGFCCDSSRIVLDEFRKCKEEPPYLSFEKTLLLGWNFNCSVLPNDTFNFSLNQKIQKNLQTTVSWSLI